jgi:hypothetical protein
MFEWQANAARKQCVVLFTVALIWCGFVAKTAAAQTETNRPASAPEETNRPASTLDETKRPASVPAEETPAETPDPWAPFHLLEGHWQGTIEGILGQGTGKRSYEFILDDKYLLMRHASVRLPQEKSPKGDYHRELEIYSYDSERETIVQRAFLVEGFVLEHTCDTEAQRVVCNTESVENGTGMRARLTLDITDRYRFVETFELASPGQELKVFFTNSWTRVPHLAD